MTVDPFTLVYTRLWTMLESRADFAGLVREGNRIRFDSSTNRHPIKTSVSTTDLPEVILTSFGGNLNLINTSSTSKVTRIYQFIISTGDLRLGEYLLPIEWAIFRAMADWRTELTSLTWNGRPFVKGLRVTTGSEGESDSERNRGIKGWSALWTIEVDMHFVTNDLVQA